jgi:hypothetical protein
MTDNAREKTVVIDSVRTVGKITVAVFDGECGCRLKGER